LGKLEELEITSRIKGTKTGQLHGHIIQGVLFLSEKLKNSELDPELKEKLIHILISHHGKEMFGSPKGPMIPEAFLIYHADELSSKLAEITEFIKDNKEETEDEFMYSYRNRRNIFLK
jgi:3'-5' exoribonuclease